MTVSTYLEDIESAKNEGCPPVVSDLFGQEKPIVPRDLLAVYDAEYRKRFECAAPIVGKKDAPLAARLLKMYSFDDLSTWLALYFVVPDKFIQQSGFTFGVFSACIAKVIQHERRVQARVRVAPRSAPSETFLEIQRKVQSEWGSR